METTLDKIGIKKKYLVIGKKKAKIKLELETKISVIKVEGVGKLKQRIYDMGITPGTIIVIKKRAPLGDPIEISIRGYEMSLRNSEAQNVIVKLGDE